MLVAIQCFLCTGTRVSDTFRAVCGTDINMFLEPVTLCPDVEVVMKGWMRESFICEELLFNVLSGSITEADSFSLVRSIVLDVMLDIGFIDKMS